MSLFLRALPYILATLVLAAIVHLSLVLAAPRYIMSVAIERIAEEGGFNTVIHAERPTAESRGVVRPSPDLLYSVCVYDVSEQPLRLTSPVPPGTYWSLSAFAFNTDNFFVVNDQQVGADKIEVVLVSRDSDYRQDGRVPVVVAPSDDGIVLFRTLIKDEEDIESLEKLRRQAACTPVTEN